MRRHAFWAALLAIGIGGEWYALKTKRIEPFTTFTQTSLGKGKPWESIGKRAYIGFAAWFWFHLFKKIETEIMEVLNDDQSD